MTLDEIRKYIQSVSWKFAKTMPHHPHFYTLKEWEPDKSQMFERFVMHIRAKGYEGKFFKFRPIYFDVDGYRYWTMGAPLNETTLINRAENNATSHYRTPKPKQKK